MGEVLNVNFQGKQRVLDLLGQIQQRLGSPRGGLEIIGGAIKDSVDENFRVGGRPTPWAKSKRVKDEESRPGGEGQTLVSSGHLRDSFGIRVQGGSVFVGTNVPYAAIHDLGGTIKAHAIMPKNKKALKFMGRDGEVIRKKVMIPEIHMPQRQFLMVQDEDWDEINRQLIDYLIKGA